MLLFFAEILKMLHGDSHSWTCLNTLFLSNLILMSEPNLCQVIEEILLFGFVHP